MKILAIYGSLSSTSINKALAQALKRLAPEGMEIELLDPGASFPLFSQDLEKNFPQVVLDYRKKIKDVDGVIIVTPEYNRSTPAALKNFIDWTSRPDGDPVFSGVNVAVTGTSNGLRGASFAQYDIRRVMAYFNARVMGQPETYVGQGDKKIAQDGAVSDEKLQEQLKKFLNAFKTFVESNKK